MSDSIPNHRFARVGWPTGDAIVTGIAAWRQKAIATFLGERERWPLWLPVGMGTGVGLYFELPAEPPLWLAPALLGAAVAAVTVAARRAPAVLPIAVAAAMIALGLTAGAFRTAWVAAPILEKELRPFTLSGRVVDVDPGPESLRLLLDRLESERFDGLAVPERVRVKLSGAAPPPAPGDRVRLRAGLMPPPEPVAPGAYDFARALFFQRIGAVGYVVGAIKPITRPEPDTVLDLSQSITLLRHRIAGRIRDHLAGTTSAVAVALLTGIRGGIPDSVMDAMRRSGLAHLLAISGLHIGLVAGILFFAVRFGLAAIEGVALRYPIKKWAAAGALAGALFYMLITGATVPTQRAFLMVALVLIAVMLDRTALSMRLVAWAALAVLALRPESLVGASFQLSFAAVVALIAAYETWARRSWRNLRRRAWWQTPMIYLVGVAFTSLIATVATGPFAAFHFNRIATFGIVANLIAVPATALWIMPWGLLAMLLMPLGLEAAALAPMGWGIELVVGVAKTASAWPRAVTLVPAMPVGALVFAVFGGLWLCLWQRRWRWAGVPVLAAGLWAGIVQAPPDILVDGSAKLFAVRGEDGRLALSSRTSARFSGKVWLRRNAQTEAARWPAADMGCDSLGCIFRAGDHTVALARDARALYEDCPVADLMISTEPVRRRCAPVVIDRFDLWREGTHAIRLGADAIVVTATRPARGRRPWVAWRGRDQ